MDVYKKDRAAAANSKIQQNKTMDIYKIVEHRPWPLPVNRWIMRQTWRNVLFLHWPIQPGLLRPHIPPALEIDTFKGCAWLGIVAFTMKGIYFRGLPFSVVPSFSEVNVRTYVTYKGKPGVFFMSLDVDDWASLNIAKRWYRLPYHPAKISVQDCGGVIQYQSVRKAGNPVAFKGSCIPSNDVYFPDRGTLDHWLTEKYCFYTTRNGKDIYHGDIHHPPWPLKKADIQIDQHTLFSPWNINISKEGPIAHFSEGVDSLMWNGKPLKLDS
ncbi:YqjF family protein [Siminovitchia sp. 179-K 8D1 HS]|uniref:YqjF family protein n=1 Tax=Siminovitchia sp. 179-K 8D1 HS TaxID=3142385 RepID=UPI0039A37EBF